MKKTVLAMITASVLVLSGCGGGEDADAQKAISDSLMEQSAGEDLLAVERADADCIGKGMVDDIGVDQLKEYGFLKEDGTVAEDPSELKLSTGDAEAMVDTLFDCADMMAMMKKSMGAELGDQDPAVKACVDEVLTEDRLHAMFVSLFSGDEKAATDELITPMTECATKAVGG